MEQKMKVQVKPQAPKVPAPLPVKAEKKSAAPKVATPIQTVVKINGEEKYKCQHCGKWINREEAVAEEQGDYCKHLREDLGFTTVTLAEHRRTMTVANPPDGWIKVASLHKICVREGIPVSAMVRAFGGDRAIDPPLHPKFKVTYSGNSRWLDPWCASPDGLNFLRSLKLAAPKKVEDALVNTLATAKT